MPGEPPALVYPRRIREMLRWVRENQAENILEAAHAIARTVLRGNTCWSHWDFGHSAMGDLFPDRCGAPEFIVPGYDSGKSRDGDLVLVSYGIPGGLINDSAKKDLFIIGAPPAWSGEPRDARLGTPSAQKILLRPYTDLWIETNVDIIGAQAKIPGSAAPLGPESGPLCGAIFWMMVADACRILARDGKPVKVRGDEPVLDDKAPRVGLDAPLMDDYFDQVMRELELVGMERGDIGRMADMVVDTLLGGGKIYFYSRYREALAGEAKSRRGGFVFAESLWDGNITGTAKDCVIMGIYQPGDEADIRNLDQFRKLGMRVGSIGPATRDDRIPEGRTAPKETDVHIGRMMDACGVFALPGLDRKVCPTSGVLVTALLWSMSTEIAFRIIERTGGDAPGVFFTGAVPWDRRWSAQLRAAFQSRGY
ncbi:MAG: phosphoheptose isomerase family protein [Candidatus Latescibacterota bacterium]